MKRTLHRKSTGEAGGRPDPGREAVSWVGRLLKAGVTRRGAEGVVRGRRTGVAGSLLDALRAGLVVGEVDVLREALSVPMERLLPVLGISKATWHRRRLAGRLAALESDRVVRLARLFGLAAEALEGSENAKAWLTSPQFGLGGAVPLEYAETEVGAREVEDLLGRIEHGVYA